MNMNTHSLFVYFRLLKISDRHHLKKTLKLLCETWSWPPSPRIACFHLWGCYLSSLISSRRWVQTVMKSNRIICRRMNEVVESRVKHSKPCSRTRDITPLSSEDLDFLRQENIGKLLKDSQKREWGRLILNKYIKVNVMSLW